MSDLTPPTHGERPAFDQTCARLLTADGEHCGKPAVEHIAWASSLENSLVCEAHWAEARARWVFYDHHPLCGMCTNPDPAWVYSWEDPPGRCLWVVTDDTAAVVELAGVVG